MRAILPLLALAITPPGPTSRPASQPLPPPQPAKADARWDSGAKVIEGLASEAENAARRGDPLALARLYRLTNFGRLVWAPDRIRTALDRIAKSRDPLVRDHARFFAARDDRRRADLNKAREAIVDLGFLTTGQWIGPFDNATGRGHDQTYVPESGGGFDRGGTRGKGKMVEWHALDNLAPDGNIELARIAAPAREATVYVAAVLESPRRTTAALRVGSIDQLRVFVNGTDVFATDTRREAHPDQDAIPIVLERGDNLVLLKSSWLGDSGRLFARITAPRGGPLRGVRWIGDRERVRKAFSITSKSKASHRVSTLTDGIERALGRAKGGKRAAALALRADLFAIASLYDARKLPIPPETDLEEAVRLAPADPWTRFFYAHRVRSRDPNLALAQWEAALASDPKFVPALLEIAEAAQRSGRVLEAHARLEEALAADPTLLMSHIARARIGHDVLAEEAAALVRLRKAPGFDKSPSALFEAARMAQSLSDVTSARRDIKRTLELDRDHPSARHMAINLALDAGDVDAALGHLSVAENLRPSDAHVVRRRARLLAGVGRNEEAMNEVLRAAKIAPGSPTAWRLAAELALLAGDKKRAIASLEHALALDAQQPGVRKHLRALSGKREELEDEMTVDAVALAREPVTPEEKRWGAMYLLDRKAVRLFDNGKSTRFEQYVVRLTNPRLEDAVRAQRIPYSPSREVVEILSAERIRPSGEVQKASSIRDNGPRGKVSGMYVDQRFKLIVFDDLDAGDLVHIRFRVDSAGDNIFGGFFGDVEALQAGVPKKNVLYTAIAPERTPLFYSTIRAEAPEQEKKDGLIKYVWSYDHVDAIEIEPYAPPYPQLGSMVSVSTYETWDDLGKWYARLFSEQLELDEAARLAGKKAVRGAKTDADKVRRLYDYVVKNTRYVGIELGIHGWKPFKASEVHRRRYGDCKDKATLLSALLRDNGVDATITLVRTSDRGYLPDEHATMWAFNHAITYVPSMNLFLDPTAEFSGSTELPYQDQGASALIVHPDGRTKKTRLPKSGPKDNRNESDYVATIRRDTSLTMVGEERFYGARASQLRQELEEQKMRKTLLERQLGQVLAGAKITKATFSDLHDIEAPVEYQYAFDVPRYGRVEGDRLILPVALYRHEVAKAYAQLATRKHPLYLDHPWSTTNTIRYQLPEGSELQQLPEGTTIESKHVSLVQKVERVPGGFQTTDTVSIKSKEIPPEDYEEFRKTCLAIDRALARAVVIKW